MTDPVFVDTKVLVYARDSTEVDNCRRARQWMQFLWRTRWGRLSTQVLSEYFVTVTRKLSVPVSRERAHAEVRRLSTWQPIPIDVDLLDAALDAGSRWQLHHGDALVVAAAQRTGSAMLLSEDLQAGQRFGRVEVVNPFRAAPGDLS